MPENIESLAYELELLDKFSVIIGIDEVGRGAIAGPAAVGVQILHRADCESLPYGLRDSKLLSEKRRVSVLAQLQDWGVGAVGYASAAEIDARGISWMLGVAGARALEAVEVDLTNAVIILDGVYDWLTPHLTDTISVITQKKADRDIAVVAAASIRAKVARDDLMRQLSVLHPEYGWASNKGYGAKSHYDAIWQHGVTELHRKTWIRQK